MSALVWRDGCGYRCPRCKLFVAIPQRDVPQYCPRCPAVESVEVTAGDRPDNGQDEEWVDEGCSCGNPSPRTYEHDPSCTLVRCRRCGMDLPDHLPGDDYCRPCTQPHLASGHAGAGEQQRELAQWLRERVPLTSWQRDIRRYALSPAQADHLAATLLDRTQPDGEPDPGPQCPSTSHHPDGGWRCAVEGPHGDGEHTNGAGDVRW